MSDTLTREHVEGFAKHAVNQKALPAQLARALLSAWAERDQLALEVQTHKARADGAEKERDKWAKLRADYREAVRLEAERDYWLGNHKEQHKELEIVRDELDEAKRSYEQLNSAYQSACKLAESLTEERDQLRETVGRLEREVKVDDELLARRADFIRELESTFGECEAHGAGCLPSLTDKANAAQARAERLAEALQSVGYRLRKSESGFIAPEVKSDMLREARAIVSNALTPDPPTPAGEET